MKYSFGIAPSNLIDWEHLVCHVVEREYDAGGFLLDVRPTFHADISEITACGEPLRPHYKEKEWRQLGDCGLKLGPFIARQTEQGAGYLELQLPIQAHELADASAFLAELADAGRLPSNVVLEVFKRL